VRHVADVLPGLGVGSGKGEALWKSLYVSSGDIVAWCDSDITNFDARFVIGLIGPLVLDPDVGFVKGFYERPVDAVPSLTGGRTTELVARPLISILFPELASIVQPLSGEYAGRRSLLELLPFATGYGVDLGLVDIARRIGAGAIHQVDLGTRTHRHRNLQELSPQALAIMQTAFVKAGIDRQGATEATLLRPGLESLTLAVTERPPMISVADYRRTAHASSADPSRALDDLDPVVVEARATADVAVPHGRGGIDAGAAGEPRPIGLEGEGDAGSSPLVDRHDAIERAAIVLHPNGVTVDEIAKRRVSRMQMDLWFALARPVPADTAERRVQEVARRRRQQGERITLLQLVVAHFGGWHVTDTGVLTERRVDEACASRWSTEATARVRGGVGLDTGIADPALLLQQFRVDVGRVEQLLEDLFVGVVAAADDRTRARSPTGERPPWSAWPHRGARPVG
jgi:hypothetical protein